MKYRCAGSQVVSVLAFYSYDPSSNLTHVFSFFCKICIWKDENKQKKAGVGLFFKKVPSTSTSQSSARRRWHISCKMLHLLRPTYYCHLPFWSAAAIVVQLQKINFILLKSVVSHLPRYIWCRVRYCCCCICRFKWLWLITNNR